MTKKIIKIKDSEYQIYDIQEITQGIIKFVKIKNKKEVKNENK
jgi:hypothetical protein